MPYYRKGFFAIITSFLLIVIIIFSLIALFQFSGISLKINKDVNRNVDYSVNANLFKDKLLYCHAVTYLVEEKLINGQCGELFEGIKGYRVERQLSIDCEKKAWDFGKVDENLGNYIFWVTLRGSDYNNCLAKLIVYY